MTTQNGIHALAAPGGAPLAASPSTSAFLAFGLGLLIVAALTWAVWLGIRVRRREPDRPRPEEQPRLPDEGPVREVQERREPDEVPRDGGRLTPHQLKGGGTIGSRPSDDQGPT
ncbi:DUF6479 family protein [Streptomyces spectabilis]|uniref:Uncharacterized protein n=1 Tax=Streptomyces spectabilis TaxID=68270 RepID=A0A5P2XKD2_STRST|nr:DUF6479 family protein [Streptomyces spectabilis]MBB5105539.1 hypothetical protein [Streptomyces spectabilis]MCI3906725.1 DUF6479 family protein [Streptomyces spectabilis]QEV63535.1 hypothetical protein CP982_36545 [Streptomyces spectabilis]GGV22258.1 hypothetical protein GCM10010245_37420 [Streptomyces spectabilis]